MQTYQMAMLLLFESINVMTCKDIQVSHIYTSNGFVVLP